MKHIVKKALLSGLLILLMALNVIFPTTVETAEATETTESELKNVLTQKGIKILYSQYDDFDGNGEYELYAVSDEGDEWSNKIYFVSGSNVITLFDTEYNMVSEPRVYTIDDTQKIAVFDKCAGTAASVISLCYYLDEYGSPKEVGVGEYLTQTNGAEFVSYVHEYDANSRHEGGTDKAYYLHWNGKGFEEYRGTTLSLKQLKKYTGASAIIKKIKKLRYKDGKKKYKYSIKKILYRKNGIININLSCKTKYAKEYINVSLDVNGKRVSLHTSDNEYSYYGGKGIWKAINAGIYKKSGFPDLPAA